jgi:predicted RNA-binding protein with PUA domain
MGTTRILMPRPGVFSESRSTPRKNEATHENGGKSFGVVYVNSLAREFVSAGPSFQFPPGAIIVREKLAKADDARPQLLTVMIKRVRGFNPKANDWEFLMLDGATNKILERQKEGSCLDCHESQKQRDYVYAPGVVNN